MTRGFTQPLNKSAWLNVHAAIGILIVMSITMSGKAVAAQPVTAEATTIAATADKNTIDRNIERQLDEYLNSMGHAEVDSRALLADIVAQVSPQTPLSTRIRALSYHALMLSYDGDHDAAMAVNDEILALTADIEIEAQTEGARAEALANRIELLRAVAETNDNRTEVRRQYLRFSIAELQTELAQWDAAYATITAAIEQAQRSGIVDNLPDLLLLKGYIEVSLGDFVAATKTMEETILLADKVQNYGVELTAFNNLGDVYIRTDQLDKAEQLLNRARELAEQQQDQQMLNTVDFNLGFVQVKRGESEAGLARMGEAVEFFEQDETTPGLDELFGEMAQAYGIAGRYEDQVQALLRERELRAEAYQTEQQRNYVELQSLYDDKDKQQQIKLLQRENDLKQQLIEINKQQQVIWVLGGIAACFATILLLLMYRAARRANTRLQQANLKLADQSLRDPLTGLWNRRALQKDMKLRPTAAARREAEIGQTDGLILLDIDFFKRINDNLGHAAGDRVLVELSKRLLTVCRDSDKLVRWGGEEFLFYVRHVDNRQLEEFTRRIIEVIAAQPIRYEDQDIQVTATAGFICLPFAEVGEDLMNWERVLQLADMALYTGKAHGRNRGVGVTELHVPFKQAESVISTDLTKAVDNGYITMVTLEGPATIRYDGKN